MTRSITAVNTMQTVPSTFERLARLAVLGASLHLVACGSNYGGGNPYVSVGGTVSGLSGGAVELWMNGGSNAVVVSGNGPFSFPLQIADRSQYTVMVGVQPAGQACTVANGVGTANNNVNTVTVTCGPSITRSGSCRPCTAPPRP